MFQITLKAARVNAGLTIIEAAKALGLGKDTLIKYEKRPELCNTLLQDRFSAVYHMPIDNIFFGKN